jgi:hypothetical protein
MPTLSLHRVMPTHSLHRVMATLFSLHPVRLANGMGCPNQEIGGPFLFISLIIGTSSYFGVESATENNWAMQGCSIPLSHRLNPLTIKKGELNPI